METIDFHGIQCGELSNGLIRLLATSSVGPRVISLQYEDGENLFVFIPEITLDCPGTGPYHLYGGHRLWHAPEDPPITYLPDDTEVDMENLDHGVRLVQRTEPKTGIQKTIHLSLHEHQAVVKVEHILTNQGETPVTLAPWAITQLKAGGVAILPQPTGPLGENPTLPNRAIVLWPYTDAQSEYIEWGNEFILLHANMANDKLKIGFPNPVGWLAYWIDELLFVKRADFNPEGEYYDFSSSSQWFFSRFICCL